MRKDSELEWLAKGHPETNPITIEPVTVSHMAEQFSWVPYPSCSPPGCPFPIKSLASSAHVSPQTIHFRVLDKSPVSGPLPATVWLRKRTRELAGEMLMLHILTGVFYYIGLCICQNSLTACLGFLNFTVCEFVINNNMLWHKQILNSS